MHIPSRWTADKANHWHASLPWLFGSNYVPSTAINQLEMWQASTFDPLRIDQELGWAHDLGMNCMRVFLHDLLWQQDAQGFVKRIHAFLDIAERHGIKIMPVLFDSCWHPDPQLGPQPEPRPGIHNSGWVQGPGREVLKNPAAHLERLEDYVTGIVSHFGHDPRIVAWDVWNEPCNPNEASYAAHELPNKIDHVAPLLIKAFAWARAAESAQPLTSGLWVGDWSDEQRMNRIHQIQVQQSDVISFHNYGEAADFETRAQHLMRYNRPLLCSEFMARPAGNTFQHILPFAKSHKIAAMNWGFVQGRTQTHLPWDSWQSPYVDRHLAQWFHEILHADGSPYCVHEAAFIRSMSAAPEQPHTDASLEMASA